MHDSLILQIEYGFIHMLICFKVTINICFKVAIVDGFNLLVNTTLKGSEIVRNFRNPN